MKKLLITLALLTSACGKVDVPMSTLKKVTELCESEAARISFSGSNLCVDISAMCSDGRKITIDCGGGE